MSPETEKEIEAAVADGMSRREALYLARVGSARTPETMELAFARGRREIGDTVSFKSGSAPGGWRLGRIIACGPRRARIKYKFYNGREAEKSVPYKELKSW